MGETFRCIRCGDDKPTAQRSEEHIFPDAIGGTLVLHDLCVRCNNVFGTAYDAPLADHILAQQVRYRLGIASRNGRVPDPLSRTGTVDGHPHLRGRIDRKEGRLRFVTTARTHGPEEPEGKTFYLDPDDRQAIEDVKKTFQARAARQGRGVVFTTPQAMPIDSSKLSLVFDVPAYDWIFGLIKIMYELGCSVLGRAYFSDPIAIKTRRFLSKDRPTADDLRRSGLDVRVYEVGNLPNSDRGFVEHMHCGYVFTPAGCVRSEVRVFETFGGHMVLSNSPVDYSASYATAFTVDARTRTWIEQHGRPLDQESAG